MDIIKYTNNTKNMKLGVHINLTSLDNLKLVPLSIYDINGNFIRRIDKDGCIYDESGNFLGRLDF